MRSKPSGKNLGRGSPQKVAGQMPDLFDRDQGPDQVLAVCCSDIHLSHKPPIARSTEKSWYDAMSLAMDELRLFGITYNCPIVVAGDIFDRWNPPPELINFAIKALPKCYAIPGQHDLPNHSYNDIRRSAYWTLVEAGVVENLFPGIRYEVGPLAMYGFPWGEALEPCKEPGTTFVTTLAVIHKYIWSRKLNTGYQGAPEEALGNRMIAKLKGFDAAIFGDNHIGFDVSEGVYNCGCLIRRKVDENGYQPNVGLLRANGCIERVPLESSKQDVFISYDEAVAKFISRDADDIEAFVQGLANLTEATVDFREAVAQFFTSAKVSGGVRKVILEAMEK